MDQNGNRQKLDLKVQRLFDFVSKRFPFFKYSNVASQIFRFLDKFVPLKLGFLKHKKGFKWKIDGWYSLWTYLTGCEPFTTKIIEEIVAGGTKNFICVGANRGWYPLIVNQIDKENVIQLNKKNNTKVSEEVKNGNFFNASLAKRNTNCLDLVKENSTLLGMWQRHFN